MAKLRVSSSGKRVVKGAPLAAKEVRNAKTGQLVTVKGVGALKDSPLKIKKGVNLLKPIAKQALVGRSQRRKAG